MKASSKRRRAEDTDRDSDESHSPNIPAADEDLHQGEIELSGHGIINHDSRLEIGRDFRGRMP